MDMKLFKVSTVFCLLVVLLLAPNVQSQDEGGDGEDTGATTAEGTATPDATTTGGTPVTGQGEDDVSTPVPDAEEEDAPVEDLGDDDDAGFGETTTQITVDGAGNDEPTPPEGGNTESAKEEEEGESEDSVTSAGDTQETGGAEKDVTEASSDDTTGGSTHLSCDLFLLAGTLAAIFKFIRV